MSKSVSALLVSLVLLVGLIWMVAGSGSRPETTNPNGDAGGDDSQIEITLYCAASNRAVMELSLIHI